MGFYLIINGVARYIDHYDPLPDDKEKKRKYRPKRPESYPRGWW